MPIFVTGPAAAVVELYLGAGIGSPWPASFQRDLATVGATGQNLVTWADNLFDMFSRNYATNAEWAQKVLGQMLGTDPANTPALRAQLTQLFDSQPADRGAIVCALGSVLSRLEGDKLYGAAAATWNLRLGEAYNQALDTEQFIVKYGPYLTAPQGVYTHALTTGADVLPGTPYDETFLARPGTLGPGDVLTGSGGDDWLLLRDYPLPSPGPMTGFTTSGIATLVANVRNTGQAPVVVVDAAGMAGLAHVVNSGSWGSLELLNLGSVVDLKLVQVVSGNTTLHYTPAALAASGGVMALTLLSVSSALGPALVSSPAGSIQVDGISRFNVTVSGADLTEIKSNALQQLVASGTGDLIVRTLSFQGNGAATPNLLDAHALAGRLDVRLATTGAGSGATVVLGGSNLDTLRFTGKLGDYTLKLGDTLTLHDNRADSGRDYSATSVERLVFADRALALDLAATQQDGRAALLVAATFGAAGLDNPVLVGKVLAMTEQYCGYTGGINNTQALTQFADQLLGSDALRAAAGASLWDNHDALVNWVYTNVYGHAPDAATRAALQAPLDDKSVYPAQWLAAVVQAAQAPLQALLMGHAQGGLVYVDASFPFTL